MGRGARLLMVILLAGLAFLTRGEAQGQVSVEPDTSRARVERIISNPGLGGPVVATRPDTRLLVTEKEKTLEVSLSADLGRDVDTGIGYRLGVLSAAPLTEGAEETVFGSLAGLATGTTVKVSLSGLSWDAPRLDEDAVEEWCEQKKTEGRLPVSWNCASYEGEDLPEELEDEHRDVTKYTEPWSLNLGFEIGKAGLDYFDPASLTEVERNEMAWSVTGAVGGFVGGALTTLEAGFARAFKPAKKQEVCAPIGATGGLSCTTAPFGSPAEVEGWVLDGAYRRFVSSTFGYALQGRYRFADDEYGVECPLYFAPDEGGSLVGGVAPAWDSENGWSVELFVGAALNFELP